MTKVEKANILGVGVSAITMGQAVDVIDRWLRNREPRYVCVTSVHGVIESQHDEQLRRIHNTAGLVTPDGMPLVWLMKQQGHHHVERVYGPDLMTAVLQLSCERGYKQFFYGASEATLTSLRRNLKCRFPGTRIAGTYSPPYRPLTEEEDQEIVRVINGSNADIVWVGLSTPKQERWMAEHRNRLHAPVTIGVGAAFDFHAGLKRQAPQAIRRCGFEWFFRLATEPRRLCKRYFRIVPSFLFLVGCQKVGIKRYLIEP